MADLIDTYMADSKLAQRIHRKFSDRVHYIFTPIAGVAPCWQACLRDGWRLGRECIVLASDGVELTALLKTATKQNANLW